MRYFVCLVAALMAMAGTGLAGGLLGFRLLLLDGGNVKWRSTEGSATVITYAIVTQKMRFPNARNCAEIVPIDGLLAKSRIDRTLFDVEVKAAFGMWESIANIEFRYSADPSTAGILIGAQGEPEGHAFANVDYRPGTGFTREIHKSLICLNPMKSWKVGFGGSLAVYDVRYTVAHEIGHAIGLDHPDPGSQLMSFKYHEQFRTLQAGDVEGAIRLYGRRRSPISSSPSDDGASVPQVSPALIGHRG